MPRNYRDGCPDVIGKHMTTIGKNLLVLRLRRNRKYILFALAVVEKELYGESFCGNRGKRDGVYEFGNICEQIIWFSLLGLINSAAFRSPPSKG